MTEVKEEVKEEVNSLRSWEFKKDNSKTNVLHEVLNFQPAMQA